MNICTRCTTTKRVKVNMSLVKLISWEANSRSASQEIPLPPLTEFQNSLRCSQIRYWTLSGVSWIHSTPTLNFPKINCNIILPSKPRSHKWPFPFRKPSDAFLASVVCAHLVLYLRHKVWAAVPPAIPSSVLDGCPNFRSKFGRFS
jgi:hypothetical protein